MSWICEQIPLRGKAKASTKYQRKPNENPGRWVAPLLLGPLLKRLQEEFARTETITRRDPAFIYSGEPEQQVRTGRANRPQTGPWLYKKLPTPACAYRTPEETFSCRPRRHKPCAKGTHPKMCRLGRQSYPEADAVIMKRMGMGGLVGWGQCLIAQVYEK